MITEIIVYGLVGIVSCFCSLVILRVNEVRDEGANVLYPLVMLILWPIGVPLTTAVYVVIGLNKLADKVATQIKANRKDR